MDSHDALRTQITRLETLKRSLSSSQVDAAWLDSFRGELDRLSRETAALRELVNAKRAERENRLLKEIGLRLMDDMDPETLAHLVMDALADIVEFDAAGLYFIDSRTGTIRWETLRGYDTDTLHLVRQKLDRGIMGWVRQHNRPAILADVRGDKRYFNARDRTLSELVVPIRHGGRMIGFFNLESDSLDSYGHEDRELLEVFASQVAQSVEQALQRGLRRDQKRVKAELKVARSIQLSLLPKEPLLGDGYSVAGLNLSSLEVGGDYYDYFPITDRDTGIVIADVAGKGIPAGLIMASFRTGLRILAQHRTDIRQIMEYLNDHLAEVTEADSFVTACYGVYHHPTGRFSYVNAGHNPPLLLRAGSGHIERLDTGGMIIGSFFGLTFELGVVDLHWGDKLVFYTDGLSETQDPTGNELGEEGIRAALCDTRGLDGGETLHRLIEHARVFAGLDEGVLRFDDDLTVMTLFRKP